MHLDVGITDDSVNKFWFWSYYLELLVVLSSKYFPFPFLLPSLPYQLYACTQILESMYVPVHLELNNSLSWHLLFLSNWLLEVLWKMSSFTYESIVKTVMIAMLNYFNSNFVVWLLISKLLYLDTRGVFLDSKCGYLESKR